MSDPLLKVNVSVVIKKDNTFLLIKRSEDEDVFPGHWGIPGGTVEKTDATLQEALARECMEEVGITIHSPVLISNNLVSKPEKTMLYMVFQAEHEAGEPKPLEDTELVEWKTLDEARELLLTPQTLDMLELCK